MNGPTSRFAGFRRRAARLTSVAVLALAVAGCSGPDDGVPTDGGTTQSPTDGGTLTASGTPEALDACEYFPAAELEEILGPVDVQTGPVGGWAAGGCTINGESSGLLVSIGTDESFIANADPALPDPASRLTAYEQESAAAELAPTVVDGLGDGALVHSEGGAAYGNSTYIEIVAPGVPTEQIEAVLTLGLTTAGS